RGLPPDRGEPGFSVNRERPRVPTPASVHVPGPHDVACIRVVATLRVLDQVIARIPTGLVLPDLPVLLRATLEVQGHGLPYICIRHAIPPMLVCWRAGRRFRLPQQQ